MPPKRPSDEVDFMEKMGKNSEEAINRFFRSLAESKIMEHFEIVYYAIQKSKVTIYVLSMNSLCSQSMAYSVPRLGFHHYFMLGHTKVGNHNRPC